jgi:L-alanine-DL-glutamate epimerase-like enolase superfamily enzyme
MSAITLSVAVERFALKVPFVIARGAKTDAVVVAVTLFDGRNVGRGECTPYARYGGTPERVVAAIEAARHVPGLLASREILAQSVRPGAARNALDCAIWDLEAKVSGIPAAERAGVTVGGVETCFTLSLDTSEAMAHAAREAKAHHLLKLKLGGVGDVKRMAAVREARPDARLVADANESWTVEMLQPFLAAAAKYDFELIEQPLPADADGVLQGLKRPVPVCADESAHTSEDIPRLLGRYDAVNIKLDKAGGLTEALAMQKAAREAGLKIMVGCMVASSLAMAPAFIVAQGADWVDLDGPLFLVRDRSPPVSFEDGLLLPPSATLWG